MTTDFDDQPHLEPCPFCGSVADLITHGVSEWLAGCSNALSGGDCPAKGHPTHTREATAEVWNTRRARFSLQAGTHTGAVPIRVCPASDRECGSVPAQWCAICPKRRGA